jgi:hypothetical protein
VGWNLALNTGDPHVKICSGREGIAKFQRIVKPSAPVISVLDLGISDAALVPFGATADNAVEPEVDFAEDGI